MRGTFIIDFMIIQRIWRISGFVQTLDGKQKETFERDENVYFHEYDPQDDLGGLSATQVAIDAINALTNTKKYIAAL
jgi:hypothetical protein